ncbi:hypothetical protein EJ04DRAFT_559929 [Polyplosphaeria fusca]|uniref:C2H2-type domain-containing protein n=1 Tax=Polyplosphaeria fusca TaxID=682080 RepID=A0A9P4R8L3_9PLEO|nr:hypothetical protein EJ04DRAFT_559929 [Polyplosphaeria fusca]
MTSNRNHQSGEGGYGNGQGWNGGQVSNTWPTTAGDQLSTSQQGVYDMSRPTYSYPGYPDMAGSSLTYERPNSYNQTQTHQYGSGESYRAEFLGPNTPYPKQQAVPTPPSSTAQSGYPVTGGYSSPNPNQTNVGAQSFANSGESAQPPYSVQCSHCKKVFEGQHAKGNLNRHEKSKSCPAPKEERPHVCRVCGKDFARSDGLRTHMKKKHQGQKQGR